MAALDREVVAPKCRSERVSKRLALDTNPAIELYREVSKHTPDRVAATKSGSDRQLEHVNSGREVWRCNELVIVCQGVPANLFGQCHVEGICRVML